MTLFIGPGVRHWAARGERGVRWIASPPLAGKPFYPAYFDLAETMRRALPERWPLLETALRALAPDWAELCASGLQPDVPRAPRADELGASDEAPIVQRFLTCGLAQVLARAPEGYGLLIRSAELWDLTSLEFLDRLVREPTRQVPVAIETRSTSPRSSVIASFTARAEHVSGTFRTVRGTAASGERILALCPHGLPRTILERLGSYDAGQAERFNWPGGGDGLVLSPGRAARLRASISHQERKLLHTAIFDAHPCEGWDYIRRSGHAVASADATRLLLQHTACLAALANTGYDHLYRHLAALATALPTGESVAAHLGAARLAPRLWGHGGRRRAVFHYRRALDGLGPGDAALPVMHELANLYANMRNSAALRRSRRWYRAAFARLKFIGDPDERRNAEIRLRNGLALVEYHEGHNEAALDHERQALALIAARSPNDQKIARWAEPLIRTNTAKLLIKRFGDAHGGITLLKGLLDNPEERIRRTCQQNLGRAYFDHGDYAGAVEHLAARVEAEGASDLSEAEELHDRFIFTLSLLALGQPLRAARQLPRMRYLANVNAAEAAEAMIARLEEVCVAAQDVPERP